MYKKLIHKSLKRPFGLYVRDDIRRQKEKYTILLLHGIATDAKFWEKFINKIRNLFEFQNCRIISLDLLGEGKSPKPDWLEYTIDDHYYSIRKTLKKRNVRSPLIIVGHSMGGLIALNFALHYPVKKLMMVGSPIMPTISDRTILNDFQTLSIKSLGSLATKNPVLGPIVKFVHSLMLQAKYDVDFVAFRRNLQHVVLENGALTELKQIKIPVYLLRGSADAFSDHKTYMQAAKQKNIHFKEIPLIGHQIHGALLSSVVEQLKNMVK